MPHFVGSHHASHLRVTACKVAAHTTHHTQRCAGHAGEAHRGIHPSQIAKVQKVVRRFHAEIDLVHFAKRRRRLVADTPTHIRKKRIDIDTVGKPPLYREAKFLIHLRSAIAHGHLHRLVAMRFQGIAPRCRIRIYNKRIATDQQGRIPDRKRIHIHGERTCRKQQESQPELPGHGTYLSLGSTIN